MWVVGCTPLVWEGRAVVRRLMSSGLQGPPLFICRGFFVYLRACLRPVSVVSCPETVYVEVHPRLGIVVGRESSNGWGAHVSWDRIGTGYCNNYFLSLLSQGDDSGVKLERFGLPGMSVFRFSVDFQLYRIL